MTHSAVSFLECGSLFTPLVPSEAEGMLRPLLVREVFWLEMLAVLVLGPCVRPPLFILSGSEGLRRADGPSFDSSEFWLTLFLGKQVCPCLV